MHRRTSRAHVGAIQPAQQVSRSRTRQSLVRRFIASATRFVVTRIPCHALLPQRVDTAVIIILKPGVTDEQIDHVIERVESLGLRAHLSRGTYRTIIGVIGDEAQVAGRAVVRRFPAWPRSCRCCRPTSWPAARPIREPSVVDVAGVKIGGGHLGMIAGPCAVEERRADGRDRRRRARPPAPTSCAAARSSRAPAPTPIRAWAKRAENPPRRRRQKHGMPVVTEVMDPRRVELVERYADMIQIGARNMQNFVLLTEVGQTQQAGAAQARHERHDRRPADERRVHPVAGQPATSCCASGASRASTPATRNLFDVAAVPACKGCRTCRSSSIPAMPRAGPI